MSAKRSADETDSVERRTRIKLSSPTPEGTSGSDTESIHSCQGYKTETANDTEDTSSPPTPTANIEYEVTNAEVPKLKFFFSDDSAEEDFKEMRNFLVATSNDSVDNAFFADTSEENSTSPTSNSDVDPELPRNDFLDFEKCLLCQTDKKNVSYPYCSACYTWKKNLFPSRPKRRKKGFRTTNTLNKNSSSNYQSIKKESSESEKKSVNDNLSDGLFRDSGMDSTDPQLSEDVVDGTSEPSTSSSHSSSKSSNLKDPESCRVCFLKRENGLFVHSNSAHLYGCYSCAQEIWYNNGGCPICRRKVFKVTKLFI